MESNIEEVRTLFVGRHKTGPCEASVICGTWMKQLSSQDRPCEASVTCGTWTPYILSAALFYVQGAILCFHSSWAHGHYEPTGNIRCAFILPWCRSRILRMSKLCSCGIEAMFLWGWSYVPVGLKLCSQCCNAIEKDCSLRREWLEPTQRTFVRQAAKTNVENRYVLPSWQNKD